jgi:hypothetical protein
VEKKIQQKTDPKTLAISNEFAKMSKKNIYLNRMGSSGYGSKIPEWNKKIEEVGSAGNPNPVDDIEERIMNWFTGLVEVDSRWQTCAQEERSCRNSRKGNRTHCKEKIGSL